MAEKKSEGKKVETKTGKAPAQAKASAKPKASEKPPTKAAESQASKAAEKPATGTSEKPAAEKKPEEKESYLKDLMAISGHGGLFRFLSQGRNGIIVESIETGKRMQAFATMKVSSLEDIAVYTDNEEVQLETVFEAIHKYENGAEAISPKSEPDELKDYFSAVIPEYDRDRVYVSDIKKILGWYNLLLKHNLIETGITAKKSADKKDSGDTGPAGKDKEGGRAKPTQAARAAAKDKKATVPKDTVRQAATSKGRSTATKPGGRKTPTAK